MTEKKTDPRCKCGHNEASHKTTGSPTEKPGRCGAGTLNLFGNLRGGDAFSFCQCRKWAPRAA